MLMKFSLSIQNYRKQVFNIQPQGKEGIRKGHRG